MVRLKKRSPAKSPVCVGEASRRHRPFLSLCSLRLCGSLKRAIACKISTVRSH
ncbi:MAG: hypothetical protein V7K97_04720 [Nostoc sp.]|uniref:hypothetical protein n=1 Tax=Nostoc sp. TaxID=1180 RepID=UPI002FF9C94C